jgi:hypothetical protein
VWALRSPQVVKFQTDKEPDAQRLHHRLNAVLPPDIRAHAAFRTAPDFNVTFWWVLGLCCARLQLQLKVPGRSRCGAGNALVPVILYNKCLLSDAMAPWGAVPGACSSTSKVYQCEWVGETPAGYPAPCVCAPCL